MNDRIAVAMNVLSMYRPHPFSEASERSGPEEALLAAAAGQVKDFILGNGRYTEDQKPLIPTFSGIPLASLFNFGEPSVTVEQAEPIAARCTTKKRIKR